MLDYPQTKRMLAGVLTGEQVPSSFASLPPPPAAPSRLEEIAGEARVQPSVLRQWLRDEIERRRVAENGDGPEAPPVHRRHRI